MDGQMNSVALFLNAAACDLCDPFNFIVPTDDGSHGGGVANVTPTPLLSSAE